MKQFRRQSSLRRFRLLRMKLLSQWASIIRHNVPVVTANENGYVTEAAKAANEETAAAELEKEEKPKETSALVTEKETEAVTQTETTQTETKQTETTQVETTQAETTQTETTQAENHADRNYAGSCRQESG